MAFEQLRSWTPRFRVRPKLVVVLLFLWGLFIVYGTLLPFQFSATGEEVEARLRRAWEGPWPSGWRADVASNVLLFLPWGFLLAVWRAERGAGFLSATFAAALSGALLSSTVEFAQLFTPSRITSTIDLATNTTGSALGALIGWPLARWFWPRMVTRTTRLVVERPMMALALATALALTIFGLSPFDFTLEFDDLKSAIKNSRLIPFGPSLQGTALPAKPWSWAGELLTWMLAGGLFAKAARDAGRPRGQAILCAVIAAGSLGLAIEAMQFVIPSRQIDMTSVVMTVLGSTLGAVPVVRAVSRDTRRWIAPALFVWGAIAILAAWTPPDVAWPEPPFLRPERFVPFWSYYVRTRVEDLADLFDQVLMFVPLGILLAALSRRRSIFQAALIGLAFGLVLETGQVFLPARTAELTDALSAAVGSGLGLALWRWAESVREPASSCGNVRYRVGPRAGLKG